MRAVVALIIGTVVGLGLVVTPASAAAPTVALPLVATRLTQVGDMVQARGRLYVSSGDEVLLLDARGRTRKRFTHLPEAAGLAVSPSGDRVYVAVHGAASVVVIDTRRRKVVERFRVDPCPTRVALAGGRLFYATGTCHSPVSADPSIASIDPVRGGVPVPSGATGVPDPALLVGAGSTVVVASAYASPSVVTSFRVSGSTLVRQAADVEDGIVWDLAISPDGATAYVPRSYPWAAVGLPTSTMKDPVAYAAGRSMPYALAVSPDGRSLATALHEEGPDLWTFRVGSTAPVGSGSTTWVGPGRPEVIGGTLTYSDDGTRLFALLGGRDGRIYLTSATA